MCTKEQIKEKSKKFYLKNKEKIKERVKAYYSSNIEKIKERGAIYYQKNKEKIKKDKKQYNIENAEDLKNYRLKNKEKVKTVNKIYHLDNKEKINSRKKQYYLDNKAELIRVGVNYKRERYANDNLYKLSQNIRTVIRNAFKNNNFSKKSKTSQILGCSFVDFKLYLESKFEPWMNWSNYGNWNGAPKDINTAWDIDHIIPLTQAKNEDEMVKLNHYTNLQPLCSYCNRYIKRDKLNYLKG